MKKNMGSLDKNIRLIFGIAIIVLGFLFNSWWGLIGIIPVLTSITSFCPFYVPLKMSTIKKNK